MNEKQSDKGKGYDNPKHWGDPAEAGDIFQVTQADASANGSYIFGDFYIAKRDGDAMAENCYYPYFGNNTDFWKHAWSGCTSTQMVTASIGSTATIYANGLHCVAIVFWFTPQDVNENIITNLPNGYFQEVLQKYGSLFQLTQYTGAPLSDGWASLSEPTPYTAVVPQSQQQGGTPTGTNSLTLYVTTKSQTAMQLGIQLTAADGTVLKYASNGATIDPVTVSAIDKIIYNSSRCTTEVAGDTEKSTTHTARLKNYYFHPTDDGFQFIHSKKTSGDIQREFFTFPPHWPNNEMIQWLYWYPTDPCMIGSVYYWDIDLGQQIKDMLGITYDSDSGGPALNPTWFSTSINEQSGALNVTLTLQTFQQTGPTDKNINNGQCKFVVYDQYGNSGQFGLAVSDYSDPNADVIFQDA